MRELRMLTLTLAALVAWGATARPAEKKAEKTMVPEEGAVQVMLLRQKSIQEALNLTPDETKQIYEFTDRQWKKALRAEELSPAEHDKAYDEMTEENKKFVNEILEPAQRKRLNQITLQVAGLMWVTHPDVAAELELTDVQKAKAKAYQEEARKEMHDMIRSETGAGKEEKLRELRATSRKRLLELLTDEQETKWKEMIGEPFTGELSLDPTHEDK